MATLAPAAQNPITGEKQRGTLAYRALLVFSFVYYTRPADVIPGLAPIPIEKIFGGLALIALFAGLAGRRGKLKIALEIKVLLLLFAHLCLAIPFAYWRGGAFSTVFERFPKNVILVLLVALIVETFAQLRTLIFVQAAAVAVMTCISVIIHPNYAGRLSGALGGIFGNPNDFAINIAINWPLCLAFLLAARGAVKKGVWAVGLIGMLYGVIATYSRAGSMAIALSMLVCVWEFGIRGRRIQLVALAGILAVLATGVALSTPHYTERMMSIISGNVEGSLDRGSWEARRQLLLQSINLSIHHPLLGIGPGNFPAFSESWQVSHNTYTELSAEAGFPALILFLLFLALAFRNLRVIRKGRAYVESEEARLFAGGMWASLAAYLVGAAFTSTEYNLFPYFMVAYTSALYRLTVLTPGTVPPHDDKPMLIGDRNEWINRVPSNLI